jgi:GDPmannose 4,6-dehydratase
MQWMMLQQEKPEDFVIATGVQYSVRDFIKMSAQELGIELSFEGSGIEERELSLELKAINPQNSKLAM